MLVISSPVEPSFTFRNGDVVIIGAGRSHVKEIRPFPCSDLF